MRSHNLLLSAALLLLAACRMEGGGCKGEYCGTLVFAATGTPVSLLPVVSDQAIDRDISGQIFLKLADIGEDGNTIGEAGFDHQLADRWAWRDSLTLAFHVDSRAKWQDGLSVTAQDVAFTFGAYTDSSTGSQFRESLARIASVTAEDSSVVVFRFRSRYPEMFYDAVYYLRILPQHLLKDLPFARWRTADFGRAPVGDGPYRFVKWVPGQSVELAADSAFFLGRPHIRRLIWRMTGDLPVAVTQVIAGEADAIEVLVSPPNIARARAAGQLRLYPYPGAVYMIARMNLRARGAPGRPHPVFGDADVRRALVLATDRVTMAQSVFGGAAKVPPAPIPQAWSTLWFKDLAVPPFDTLEAARLLAQRGWREGNGDPIREKGGRKLSFALAVPASSAARRMYAQLIQEALRRVGVQVTIEEMDPAALQDRLHRGDFDAAIEAWANDPTPSSGVPEMWKRGGSANFGGYASAAFDGQLARVAAARTPEDASAAYESAFRILAQDAPAIVLAAPDNVAAIHRRFTGVRLRADEYWAYVREWRIPPGQLTPRDRVER